MLGRAWPNIVKGRQVSGRAYEVYCPFDRELLVARLVEADKKAVKAAVEAARAAFPGWSGLAYEERVEAMRRFARALETRKYHLGMAAMFEVGKSRLEAIGEAEEAVDLIDWYCDEMERNHGFERSMSRAVPQEETQCRLCPVGAFAVIAPFNFPVAPACNMLGACLIAGNTAVFAVAGSGPDRQPDRRSGQGGRASGGCPQSCRGEATGEILVDLAGNRRRGVTGSHEVGMKIFRKFASGAHMRPVIAEMGGKNPAYVTALADLDAAAEGVARSAFGLTGEKCSACSVVYVDRQIESAFLEQLRNKTQAMKIGTPEERATFIGPVIDEAAVERYEAVVRSARQVGRIVHGGNRVRSGALARGLFVEPTIVADLPCDHWLNREEVFLPFLSVQAFERLEDALVLGNGVNYGLTAGLYSQDPDDIELFKAKAQAGVLYVNRRSGATTGAWPGYQSFCGWKGSGVDGKGGLGPWTIPRYMREQSRH